MVIVVYGSRNRQKHFVDKGKYLDTLAKFLKASLGLSVRLSAHQSVHPHGTSRLPLDGFS